MRKAVLIIGLLVAIMLALATRRTARTPPSATASASLDEVTLQGTHRQSRPQPFRVTIRPVSPPVQPMKMEGFVRGNTTKPNQNLRPVGPKPAPQPTQPAKPEPARIAVAAVSPPPNPTLALKKNTTQSPALQNSRTPSLQPSSPVELGRQLLGSDGKREGKVPLISMDYRSTLGWNGYVAVMKRLGGQFFIYDGLHDRILARVDVERGELTSASTNELRRLSPRVREIQNEPAIEPLLVKARKQFNAAEPSLILLLPLEVDFEIVGGVVKALANLNVKVKSVSKVTGYYERMDGCIRMHISIACSAEGKTIPLDLNVALDGGKS